MTAREVLDRHMAEIPTLAEKAARVLLAEALQSFTRAENHELRQTQYLDDAERAQATHPTDGNARVVEICKEELAQRRRAARSSLSALRRAIYAAANAAAVVEAAESSEAGA